MSTPSCLVVDPSAVQRDACAAMLRAVGMRPLLASSSSAALHVLATMVPDVIVVDLASSDVPPAALAHRVRTSSMGRVPALVGVTRSPLGAVEAVAAGYDAVVRDACEPAALDAVRRAAKMSRRVGVA